MKIVTYQYMELVQPPCAVKPTLKYDVDEHYSREQCLTECTLDRVFEFCQCLPFFDSPYYRMCEIEEVEDCYRYC